jgi:hypothetical protein
MIRNPTTIEIKPFWIDSAPSVGPTTASSTMIGVAGRDPAFRILARSAASSFVKFPEMIELPKGISSFTPGAE